MGIRCANAAQLLLKSVRIVANVQSPRELSSRPQRPIRARDDYFPWMPPLWQSVQVRSLS